MAFCESSIASSMLTSIICAPFSTCWRATDERLVVVAGEDQAGEGPGAGDVGALADVDEQRVVADVERLQARQAQLLFRCAEACAAAASRTACGDRADVLRRGAAAAADDVEEAALGEFAQQAGGVVRRLVVAGFRQRVGQPGVGIAADEGVGDASTAPRCTGASASRPARSSGPRRAARVAHRIPERLGRLAGERAARTGR